MTAVKANGIEIEYSDSGPRDGPVIMLIMGLGMQLVAWPDAFCEGLAARGFRVIRFDNRDAGLSTKMRSAGRLPMAPLMALALLGLGSGCLIRSTTWRRIRSGSWMRSGSIARISSAPRWAA